MLLVSEEPEEILDRVQSYIAPDLEKWVETRKRTWAIPATIHKRGLPRSLSAAAFASM